MSENSQKGSRFSIGRRDFLTRLTFWALGGSGLLALLGSLQLPFPRVFRTSSKFKVGRIVDFPVNVFTFIPEKNIYVLRERHGIRALSATCTHLGCVVQADDEGFICPCHGSRYNRDGEVLNGPAPRQLAWLKTGRAPDGQIMVDTSRKVKRKDFLKV